MLKARSHNNRLLIVDDEPKNIEILEYILKGKYELIMAQDGCEALEKCSKYVPAVVLLDIMMPHMDGYEVCEKIRENEENKLVKVVFLSARALLEERIKGYQVGADDYLTKPFEHEELEAKVKIFMDLYNTQMELKLLNENLEKEIQARTDQLLNSERMAFIGMHSAQVVHNLKNPLTVLGFCSSKLLKVDPNNKEYQRVKKVSDQMLDIVKSMLTSVKDVSTSDQAEFSISELIEDEMKLLKLDDFLKYNVEVKLDLQAHSPIVGIPIHFRQVFSNLVKNSLDAMHESAEKKLEISTYENEGRTSLLITDTGEGIPQENLEKVLQPLFTTKAQKQEGELGSGSGLGLAYCKKMIESYGGEIAISSKVGSGTTITISIPHKKVLQAA